MTTAKALTGNPVSATITAMKGDEDDDGQWMWSEEQDRHGVWDAYESDGRGADFYFRGVRLRLYGRLTDKQGVRDLAAALHARWAMP